MRRLKCISRYLLIEMRRRRRQFDPVNKRRELVSSHFTLPHLDWSEQGPPLKTEMQGRG